MSVHAEQRIEDVKSGSGMSRKQLGRAAAEGKPFYFKLRDGDGFIAYLAGMDDYTYLVVIPGTSALDPEVELIQKSAAYRIRFMSGPILDDHTQAEQIGAICNPFRTYCIRTFTGRKD